MREAISIELDGQWLHGTRHVATCPRKRGVLFFNSGAQPRSGRGDLNARLADAIALQGYPSFRFDLPGLGDSEGGLAEYHVAFYQHIQRGGYRDCAVELTRQLLQAHQLDDMVLFGLCGGAITSVLAASSLPRAKVAGLVLLDLPFFISSTPSTARAKVAEKNSFRSKARGRGALWKATTREWLFKQSWEPHVTKIYRQARNLLHPTKSNQMPADTNLALLKAMSGLVSQRTPMLLFSLRLPKPLPLAFDYIGNLQPTSSGTLRHLEVPGTSHSFIEDGGPAVVQEAVLKWLSDHAVQTDPAQEIMQKPKYYDHKNNRPLNLGLDGCDLAQWRQFYGKATFARHPKSFNIFIPPDRIPVTDEYADSDPYTVEQNIGGAFHTRRKEITIDLLREAVLRTQGKPQILDLGCGQGHITESMREALNHAEFTGLDYSVSAIEYAHAHFPHIDFAVGDAYDCPYVNDFFDVVVCNNLWEHVPDPLLLLSKITRNLKPGGYLIVSTPSRYRIGNLLNILRGKPVEFMSPHHVTEYTVGQVVEQLAYGGFQVKRIVSRPISAGSLKANLLRGLFAKWIAMIGSHHQLEATIFYLAQKVVNTTDKAKLATPNAD